MQQSCVTRQATITVTYNTAIQPIWPLGPADLHPGPATWRTSTRPRFSVVIGLTQLFNSVREKHVVRFIDRCSLQTKDWKALHMSQICKQSYLTGRVLGLHISWDGREWPRSHQTNPLVKIKASPLS